MFRRKKSPLTSLKNTFYTVQSHVKDVSVTFKEMQTPGYKIEKYVLAGAQKKPKPPLLEQAQKLTTILGVDNTMSAPVFDLLKTASLFITTVRNKKNVSTTEAGTDVASVGYYPIEQISSSPKQRTP